MFKLDFSLIIIGTQQQMLISMLFSFYFNYRLRSCHVECAYSGTNMEENFKSATIDIVANVQTEKVQSDQFFSLHISYVSEEKFFAHGSCCSEQLVVLGGSGFVGSAICKAAVSKGIEVVSLSRFDLLISYLIFISQTCTIVFQLISDSSMSYCFSC